MPNKKRYWYAKKLKHWYSEGKVFSTKAARDHWVEEHETHQRSDSSSTFARKYRKLVRSVGKQSPFQSKNCRDVESQSKLETFDGPLTQAARLCDLLHKMKKVNGVRNHAEIAEHIEEHDVDSAYIDGKVTCSVGDVVVDDLPDLIDEVEMANSRDIEINKEQFLDSYKRWKSFEDLNGI